MIRQPVLSELSYFVTALANSYRGNKPDVSPQLVECSLNLLQDVPAARDLVIEYFSMVFDVSVGNYIVFYENDPQATPADDETVLDIQDALDSLVSKGSSAWSPLISSWSLRLLGTLSSKHTRGRPMEVTVACNFWMGSNAMRCLLGLTATCFSKLNSTETEDCITTMLATFVQHSPHFDWVVARLGGCFPYKVISKILHCGLKGFVNNVNSTIDSEVGILGYLSFAHGNDLKVAIKEMLIECLSNSGNGNQFTRCTIPYFLHLCSLSEIILQSVISVFLEIYNESMIPIIMQQSEAWPPSFNSRELMPTLINLFLKFRSCGTKTIMLLANISLKYNWCQELLECVLHEMDINVWDDRICPIMSDLIQEDSREILLKACFCSNAVEQQVGVRLILIAAVQSFQFFYQTIAELLTHCYEVNNQGLGALIRLLGGNQGSRKFPEIGPGIELAIDRMLLKELANKTEDFNSGVLNVLKNFVTIVRLEKQSLSPHLQQLVSTTIVKYISKILQLFESLLAKVTQPILVNDAGDGEELVKRFKSNDFVSPSSGKLDVLGKQLHTIATLLEVLEVGGRDCSLNMAEVIKLAHTTVKYFFWSLMEKSATVRSTAVGRCYTMLSRQCCTRKASRTSALLELLQGAIFNHCELFGSHNETDYLGEEAMKDKDLLMKLNHTQGLTNATRSVLHAGVIGRGLKLPNKEAVEPDPAIKNSFLMAIIACCKDVDIPNTIDGFSTVSLLLVEMVSTDVMYNGLPWPEDEFTKVTMERDLQIRRTFKNSPILWSILGVIATYRPALCYASVLLRALCASVLHQWRAKTADKFQTTSNNVDLLIVTNRLLQILAIGQLLPPPLSSLHIVLEHLDPPEIAHVLKECVWNYMKDYVPAPVQFRVDISGLRWRDPATAKPLPQYIDPLRNIMHKRLSQLGQLYHQMFVLSELSEKKSA